MTLDYYKSQESNFYGNYLFLINIAVHTFHKHKAETTQERSQLQPFLLKTNFHRKKFSNKTYSVTNTVSSATLPIYKFEKMLAFTPKKISTCEKSILSLRK